MSFFKKFQSALQNDKNSKINKSTSLGNLKSPGPVQRPDTPPLAEFISETLGTASVDLGASRVPSSLRKSRLSKTTKEVLHDPPALAYFIQYLEARDAVQLVKFWLDVEGFKSSAAAVISTPFVPDKVGDCPQTELDLQAKESEILPQSDSFDSGLGRQDLDLEADLTTEDEVEDKDNSHTNMKGEKIRPLRQTYLQVIVVNFGYTVQ